MVHPEHALLCISANKKRKICPGGYKIFGFHGTPGDLVVLQCQLNLLTPPSDYCGKIIGLPSIKREWLRKIGEWFKKLITNFC